MRVGLLVCLAACWSSSPVQAPVVVAALPPLPPCPMRLDIDEGRLFVNDVDLGVMSDDIVGRPAELSIFQTGADAFVAYRDDNYHSGPRGGSELWHVQCGGKRIETIAIPDVDFGHAALHPDRRRLFYTGPRGVMQLDLVTRKHTKITAGGWIAQCWDNGEHALSDVVRRVESDYLEFTRGGPCGFEADYDGKLMRRHLVTGVEEQATPVIAIARGTATWLASATNCPGSLYRSTDWTTWKEIKVPDGERLEAIIAEGKTVLALSSKCQAEMPGGVLLVSHDDGTTWKQLGPNHVVWMKGAGLADLTIGTVDQVKLQWRDSDFVETGSWKNRPPSPTEVVVDGRKVRLTSFGLRDASTGQRLFPR